MGRHIELERIESKDGLEGFADKARKDSESGTFWVRGTFEPSPAARLAVSEAVDRRREVLRKLLKAIRLKPRTRESLLLRLRGASTSDNTSRRSSAS